MQDAVSPTPVSALDVNLVALNPQPLPPRTRINLVGLNPQPLPPDATISFLATGPHALSAGHDDQPRGASTRSRSRPAQRSASLRSTPIRSGLEAGSTSWRCNPQPLPPGDGGALVRLHRAEPAAAPARATHGQP